MVKFVLKKENGVQMEVYFQTGNVTISDEIIKISVDRNNVARPFGKTVKNAPTTVKRPLHKSD